MPKAPSPLLQYIRMIAGTYRNDPRSDAELLDSFAKTHDDNAFATLMGRHGPLVWSVCRRILGDTHDAEDAFQGTFLALSNKASKIHVTETLAGWLHLVARRTARHSRSATISSQKKLIPPSPSVVRPEQDLKETQEVLHDELAKLPEKLRVAIVLHYLECKTEVEVARILGVTDRTVRNRLAQGKSLLEARLCRQGVSIGATTLATWLAKEASSAAMPPGLVTKTVKAAAAFREGTLSGALAKLAREVMKQAPLTTPWWKSGWMVCVICVGTLAISVGGVAWKAGFLAVGGHEGVAVADGKSPSPAQEGNRHTPKLDRYGDPLPPGAITRLGTMRNRIFGGALVKFPQDFGGISKIAFTRNGKELVISDGERSARIAEASTGRLLRKIGSDVKDFAVSRDERAIVTRGGGSQSALSLWDLRSGKLVRKISVSNDGSGTALAISHDSKLIASPGPIGKNPGPFRTGIHLWRALTGEHVQSFASESKQQPILFITFSTDDKVLIAADQNEVQMWDVTLGKPVRRFGRRENRRIKSFHCSSDGRLAVLGYGVGLPGAMPFAQQQGEACIWNTATGKQVRQIAESKFDVVAVAFAPDGKTVATGDVSGDVRLRDVASGAELRRFRGCQGSAHCITFSPDGSILAAGGEWGDQTVHQWEVHTGREISPALEGHQSCILAASFARNGRDVVSLGCDGACHVWDAEKGTQRGASTQLIEAKRNRCISGNVSTDGKNVAIAELGEQDASIKVLHRGRGNEKDLMYSAMVPVAQSISLALSPDGKLLACSGMYPHSGTVLVDTSTGRIMSSVEGAGLSPTFSADGKSLAAVTLDSIQEPGKGVAVWDVQKNVRLSSFLATDYQGGRNVFVSGVCFSPDGRTLITAGVDGKIRLWNWQAVRKGERLLASCRQEIDFSGNLWTKVICSPDGAMIAANDRDDAIHLLEASTGKERACFKGHERSISSLAFSPDGRRLMSGSRDTTILIWDVTGRFERGRLLAATLTKEDMKLLWAQMAGGDAALAARSIWTLVSAGTPTVAFLDSYLQSASPNEVKEMLKLVAKLDDRSFLVRRQAREKLTELWPVVESELRSALQGNLSVEQRSTLRQILERIRVGGGGLAPGEEVRTIRSIEVLEQIGTPDARVILERLAAGRLEARRTQTARAALDRLKKASGS